MLKAAIGLSWESLCGMLRGVGHSRRVAQRHGVWSGGGTLPKAISSPRLAAAATGCCSWRKCVCVCVCACAYACICVRICVHMRAYACTCLHMIAWACTSERMRACARICARAFVCMRTCACICVRTCMYACACVRIFCTRMHAYDCGMTR